MENGKRCEPSNISYMSNPPQAKCKNCGLYWTEGTPTPMCYAPAPTVESTQAISGWVEAGESKGSIGWEDQYFTDQELMAMRGRNDILRLKIHDLLSQQRREMVERVEKLKENHEVRGVNVRHNKDELWDCLDCNNDGIRNGALDAALAILKENI